MAERDFTVNALMWDPLSNIVYDYVGGVADLSKGVLRTCIDPVSSFAEDPARILRGVRVAARAGRSHERQCFEGPKAVCSHAPVACGDCMAGCVTHELKPGMGLLTNTSGSSVWLLAHGRACNRHADGMQLLAFQLQASRCAFSYAGASIHMSTHHICPCNLFCRAIHRPHDSGSHAGSLSNCCDSPSVPPAHGG